MPNIFENIPDTLKEEFFETLAEGKSVRVERIVSEGHVSPDGFWYDQEEHEWVILLEGEARIDFEKGKTTQLHKGDHVLIPAHRKHKVSYTSTKPRAVWLAVFFKAQ
ncbi:hypothetical protein FUAX_45780 (plasmid) [Fulvitalea axinellae]|uniref:Cupin type-2 domain-containing protein n=1 Tax=Fulvitalea axinellae TaxID=1182444 RepID=A0AAU9DG93_9BACT|nr:hypothetical protein FUAX_45780 [Fulvitalea axinellae]